MTSDVTPPPPAEAAPDTLLTIASLSLIAEHLHQPLFAKDRELRYVLVNAAFCALLDRPRQALLGRTHSEVFGASPDVERADAEAFDTQRPRAETYALPGSSGTPDRRPGTRIPISDSQGRVTHVVGILGRTGEPNATAEQLDEELERYANERTTALRAVQEQLLRKERLMVLGQLAAGLAHQIRNPLGAIANAIALARRQIGPEQKIAAEALAIANEEIWEANRIISDLLDYARIRPAARSDTPIQQLVSDALNVESLPTSIEVALELEPVSVAVDQRQVRDALRNVIRNAREAMEGRGRLTFTSRTLEQDVELRIQDTGVGVPEEHRHLLFEPLVSSKPLGIGLGLPTARALIMNQGGTLECVSSNTEGALFLVRLPRRAPTDEDTAKEKHADR